MEEKIYLSADDIATCVCCGRECDTRLGYCFNCAEAECIIETGEDMYDRSLPESEKKKLNSESMARLKFLINKGWVFKPKDNGYTDATKNR